MSAHLHEIQIHTNAPEGLARAIALAADVQLQEFAHDWALDVDGVQFRIRPDRAPSNAYITIHVDDVPAALERLDTTGFAVRARPADDTPTHLEVKLGGVRLRVQTRIGKQEREIDPGARGSVADCGAPLSAPRRGEGRMSEPLYRFTCENCGATEVATGAEAFEKGWDYPPGIYTFGEVSPRLCPKCPLTSSTWAALALFGKSVNDLTEHQREVVLPRIAAEPESLLVQ